jgi:uncharacterized protein (DUF1330 family)
MADWRDHPRIRRTAIIDVTHYRRCRCLHICCSYEKRRSTNRNWNCWAKIRATLEGRPIRTLAAYGRHVTLEGPDVEVVVVAEFPTLEEARAWYDSPAYQEAAQHRFRGAIYRGLIVEGV